MADYWQGDEEEFSKTLEDSKPWIELIVWDESAEAYTIPVSMSISEDTEYVTEPRIEENGSRSSMILGVLYAGIRCIQRDLPITSEKRRLE